MKKQIAISLSVMMLAIGGKVFASWGRRAPAPATHSSGDAGSKATVGQNLTSADEVASAYSSDANDLIAGAASVAAPGLNVSGANTSSNAFKAGASFARTGSATAPASPSKQSDKLGRLSR